MDGIRWEEIWDVALRIRSTFLAEPLSELLRITVAEGLKLLNSSAPLAVRSSAIGEDAALLYRQELGLDPSRSRMAVVVREMVHADHSGVAFARDPRDMRKDHAIIESVPGPCSLLVDGLVDPDRWVMHRATCDVVEWLSGQREDSTATLSWSLTI